MLGIDNPKNLGINNQRTILTMYEIVVPQPNISKISLSGFLKMLGMNNPKNIGIDNPKNLGINVGLLQKER